MNESDTNTASKAISISSDVEVEILSDISRIANSETDLDDRLNLIITVIIEKSGADSCTILLMEEDQQNMLLKATHGLNDSVVNSLRISKDTGIVGWTVREKKPVAAPDAASDYRFTPIPETGEDRYCSVLTVPLVAHGSCIGVVYTQSIERREYTERDIRLLSLIADQISGIIRNVQLLENTRQNFSELLLVHEITQALSSTFNLDELLSLIVKRSTETVNARGCAIWIRSEKYLCPKAHYGVDEQFFLECKNGIGGGVIGEVARDGKPILIKDISDQPEDECLKRVAHTSVLCVPLTVKSNVIGVLSLFDKVTSVSGQYTYFSEHDHSVLSVLGGQAAVAIDKAMMYEELENVNKEKENKIEELSLLYDISVAMQSTVNLNKIIRIILSCVTVGDVFGFNRAMLFLLQENTYTLQGMMGLGPDSSEQAFHIWGTIPKITNLVQWLISQEENPPETGVMFDKLTKELSIPITRDNSVLSRVIFECTPVNVKDAYNDATVNPELLDGLRAHSFAVVPIIAQDQVLGVIVVDNLYSGREILDTDVQSLVRFASHVGYAVQNIRLFSKLKDASREMLAVQNQLIQAEKLSALGELTAELAHELKNPLMVIGGFARRLVATDNVDDKNIEEYSGIISKEVERTEKLLKEILVHSRFIAVNLVDCDLNKVADEILSFYELVLEEKGITIEKNLSPEIQDLMADSNQIKQVVTNMVHNSMEAMPEGGQLVLRTEPLSGDCSGAKIIIEDTGGGVDSEILKDIFNPFFTTKQDGTGLGLHLCKKIIEAHGGTITIENRDEGGARSCVSLPYNNKQICKINGENDG